MKYLILNADDFGFSPGINRGILELINQGCLTSASVMVKTPYIHETRAIIRIHRDFDWGLHVVIDEAEEPTSIRIGNAAEKQIDQFTSLFGFTPSHLDFHKGFKFNAQIYFKIRMIVAKHGIAFRYDNSHKVESSFYGYKNKLPTMDDIQETYLIKLLANISEGVTELICHPGNTGNRLRDPYKFQRNIELKTLKSNRIKKVIREQKISLINFKDYIKLIQ